MLKVDYVKANLLTLTDDGGLTGGFANSVVMVVVVSSSSLPHRILVSRQQLEVCIMVGLNLPGLFVACSPENMARKQFLLKLLMMLLMMMMIMR